MSKKIEVLKVEEQEDGGAIISLDLGDEAVEMLVQYAVKDILTKAAERDITEALKDLKAEDICDVDPMGTLSGEKFGIRFETK